MNDNFRQQIEAAKDPERRRIQNYVNRCLHKRLKRIAVERYIKELEDADFTSTS
jgi:hypothetical protein